MPYPRKYRLVIRDEDANELIVAHEGNDLSVLQAKAAKAHAPEDGVTAVVYLLNANGKIEAAM